MRNLALMWVLAGVAVALLAAGDGKPSVSTFTDKRDGKVYKIVKIGSQIWFAENLNYAAEGSKCFGEGGIVKAGGFTNTLSDAEVQAHCAKYGRLYNWETALKACPAGYHLPLDDEWTALVNYAGGKEKEGKKLMSKAGWNNNGNGTDDYGWSALPGGFGYSDGNFGYAGHYGSWWSATENDAYNASSRYMDYGHDYVYWLNFNKAYLFSVRCVLDDEKESQK